MSRLKLIFLVFIIAILGIVFVQNREPLALKLLCPDRAESCLYQTRDLPLAIWMSLFILGGILTSLLSHVFNRYRYANYGRPRSYNGDFESDSQWSARNGGSDRYSRSSNEIQDSDVRDRYTSSSYEIPQKPESVERSGTTYSYKYRDARDAREDSNGLPKDNKTAIDSEIDSSIDRDKDDEDWI